MVSRLPALLGVLVAFGCAESPVQPAIPVDDFELPEPDLSLDPERIRTGDILATECAFGIRGDRLVDLRDVYEWRTVDIFLPPGTATRPTPADLERFEKYGVRVLHTFNLRAVRGRVVVAAIPELVLGVRGGIVVRDVPDPRRFDVPSVMVAFGAPLRDSHFAAFHDLGGRVDLAIDNLGMVSGVLPDHSIPMMRGRSDVGFVEAGGVGCLAS